jgi:flagellar biosynthesis protein FlhB
MLLNCLVNFDVSASSSCLKSFGKLVTTGILGVLISVAIIGTLSEGLQVGFRFEATLLALKGSRLDPVRGMQRMGTGIRECWEVILKGFLLITVSTWHLLTAVEGSIPLLLGGGDRVAWVLGVLWGFLLTTGAVLLLMGGGDYFLRRWRYQRDLSMSRDELRREQKEQDGDPLFRAVRKGMHEALLMQDLERRVRRSKVIVVERNTPSE